MSSADLTPLHILKLISTRTSVTLSVNLIMGTVALSKTLMDDCSAIPFSISSPSNDRRGSSSHLPMTTRSMSLKFVNNQIENESLN